jgi:type VI secretion system protein ImpH
LARPQRYRFDAAVRVLAHAAIATDPADAVRFRAPLGTAYAGAEVFALREIAGKPPVLTTPVMGLTGPTGVLPRHYGEILHTTVRNRSTAMQAFLELLSQRFIAHFARAGTKYRPHRAAEAAYLTARAAEAAYLTARAAPEPRDLDPVAHDPIARALMAFIGYATPHLVPRLTAGSAPLLHYAGLLSMRPRSADRLGAMLSDWLGRPVEVAQFVGDWLSLPSDQRTRLPLGRRSGAFNRLGMDAAIGERAWDVQARVLLRIGPLDGPGFASLLPDRLLLVELVSLTRAFLGFETGFAINPVLAANAVPVLQLVRAGPTPQRGGGPPARLGWNTWLPVSRARRDAADAVFAAEMVEAEEARLKAAQAMAARRTA